MVVGRDACYIACFCCVLIIVCLLVAMVCVCLGMLFCFVCVYNSVVSFLVLFICWFVYLLWCCSFICCCYWLSRGLFICYAS